MIELSIISVNFNSYEDTCDMIESILRSSTKKFEIIIIDNGSSNNEAATISDRYNHVKNLIIIRSEKNLGFAGGNNLGLKYANGRNILFINNDTIVTNHSIQILQDILDENPEIGIVSPKILYANPGNRIQYAGSSRVNRITLRNHHIGNKQLNTPSYSDTIFTHYAHGAAMMISKQVIEEVGPMCEDFFLYYEEIDWCERIRKHGYKILYCGSSEILHKESASVGKDSVTKIYYLNRNRFWFAKRNLSKTNYLLAASYMILISFPKNLITHISNGYNAVFSYLKAILHGLFYKPHQLTL